MHLHGSDIHLVPKGWTRRVVVSSTLHQTLASLTPTVVPDTRYFETIPVDEEGFGAVVKYFCVDDLVAKLRRLIEDADARRRVVEEAKRLLAGCNRFNVARALLGMAR